MTLNIHNRDMVGFQCFTHRLNEARYSVPARAIHCNQQSTTELQVAILTIKYVEVNYIQFIHRLPVEIW